MSRNPATFKTVREMGTALPNVEEGTVYSSPALKVRGRMFACMAIHRSAEPDTLALRLPFKERDRLIAGDPTTFYLTDHYVDYPVVLVRLARVRATILRTLLKDSWTFMSAPRTRVKPQKRSSAARTVTLHGRGS